MRIVCNGYIDAGAGSISHASYLLLSELLRRGHEVTFVSKKSFIYPQDLLEAYPNLSYVDSPNTTTQRIDDLAQSLFTPAGLLSGILNHRAFGRCVMRQIRRLHQEKPFDAMLSLGLPAFARVDGLRTVSWVQGAPGTDVRSLWHRGDLLLKTEGRAKLSMLRAYGWLRIRSSRSDFSVGGTIIVGSRWSANMLVQHFGVAADRVAQLPYPLDLALFAPRPQPPPSDSPLSVLWLGRIVPRKRLDLFLDAAARAHRASVPIRLTIVGGFSFAPGLKKLIDTFPHPEILHYMPRISRTQAATMLGEVDVLCQPSDEEDFGSSIAEAMACGTPAIVGATNGTADYICSRSIQLTDDSPDTLADAFRTCYERKKCGTLIDVAHTRGLAERHFSLGPITDALERLLQDAEKC
jgi:glycosyltransferase involved in cell wall biosynthesis